MVSSALYVNLVTLVFKQLFSESTETFLSNKEKTKFAHVDLSGDCEVRETLICK